MYYSPSARGFYSPEIHGGSIPEDAISIPDEAYQALMLAQSQGAAIEPDESGSPAAVWPPGPTAESVFAAKITDIRLAEETTAKAVKVPYSAEEAQTWWCQYHEAEEWTANPSYVPVMLNAMVAASAGGWTLAGLAASILANADRWKAASGDIFGQRKAKIAALEALRDRVIAGTAPLADLQAFDTSITPPTVSLEDKF